VRTEDRRECEVTVDRLSEALHAEERPPTTVLLPNSARSVAVATVLRRETRWAGEVPQSFRVVPNKPALAFGDHFLYPEFILFRLLEQPSWSGVWVKNWHGRAFWTEIKTPIARPPAQARLFETIEQSTGNRRGGCWDIFASRDSDICSSSRSSERMTASDRRRRAGWNTRSRTVCPSRPSSSPSG
jgi:hypothetical protein